MNDIRDNSGSYLLQRMLNCYNTLRAYDGKTTRRMFLSDKNISVISYEIICPEYQAK